MAAEYAKKVIYGNTYGNVAYDLERVKREWEYEEYDVPAEAPAQPERKRKTATRVKQRAAANKRGVSAFSVAGFITVAVLVVIILLANVQLTEISANTTQARETLSELKKEKAQLLVQYETTFNLNEIRTYAIEELGMVEASEGETVSVNGTGGDKAVILDSTAEKDRGVFSGVATFLTSILEYFK